MADDPLTPTGAPRRRDSPFAAPAGPAGPAAGPPWREAAAFGLTRIFVLVVGPAMFALVPSLLGAGSVRNAALGAAVGMALWVPSSFVLFRLLFFPAPADPGLHDGAGRPVSARDLRLGLGARAAEHVLGTAPLLLLVPYAWRAFATPWAVGTSVAVTAWVAWREVVHAGQVLVEDADILLHSGLVDEALARVTLAARWFPRTGDAGAIVLARARFRTGDARGAVAALDAVRDRSAARADLLRAQMGVDFLPDPEIEAAIAKADADPELRLVAHVLRALRCLRDGAPYPEELVLALTDGCTDARGLPCLLAAAGLAQRSPARAAALLEGWSAREWSGVTRSWPAVARALAPVAPR